MLTDDDLNRIRERFEDLRANGDEASAAHYIGTEAGIRESHAVDRKDSDKCLAATDSYADAGHIYLVGAQVESAIRTYGEAATLAIAAGLDDRFRTTQTRLVVNCLATAQKNEANALPAFAILFDIHCGIVTIICRKYFKADNEDAVRDTFIKAWDRLSKCRDRSRFSGWLSKVAKRVCLQILRARKRRLARETRAHAHSLHNEGLKGSMPEAAAMQAETVMRFKSILTADEYLIFTEHKYNGLTLGQIAAAHGRPFRDVQRIWKNAQDRLRQEFKTGF